MNYLLLSLSGIALFLSLWIVVPAPTRQLLPLGVGAPEISLWLLLFNTIVLVLSLVSRTKSPWLILAVICSLIALLLSSLPLGQLFKTQQQLTTKMSEGLGANYLAQVPTQLQSQMRSQPFSLVDAFTGIKTPKVRHTKGITFAKPEGVPLSMEIYRPLQMGQYPGIVVLYGGGWQNGSPSDHPKFNRYLAARGYTVFAIDYRHAPRYQFPAQLDDVQTALAFIQQHAAKYETDATRLALMGRSAGGHLAMLAAYHQNALPVKAVVSYYGPFNLTKGYQKPPKPDPLNVRAVLSDFLGGSPKELSQQYRLASPTSYITRPLPPTLLVHGSRDHIVKVNFAQDMHKSLQTAGNISVLLEIPWAEHSFDSLFNGLGNQLALYHTERFLAWAFYDDLSNK